MSSNRTVAIVIVALIHVVIGYALVSGLAYNVFKKAATDLKTFDVQDEPPPPPEEPPPPQKTETPPPPQVAAPPPLVRTNTPPPPVSVTPTIPPPAPPVLIERPAPPAPPAPPPAPPPPVKQQAARAKANLASYISDSDYPDDAVRAEEQGTTRFTLQIGSNGRVTGCSVTGTSGSRSLDNTTCRIMQSRARFTPAVDSNGQPTGDSYSGSIRWVLPAQ
ncbi:energy transducer TonB [Sphingomonas ginkgonis]|nr:energy transducer TonB [Sphingomonas ginkgonis]